MELKVNNNDDDDDDDGIGSDFVITILLLSSTLLIKYLRQSWVYHTVQLSVSFRECVHIGFYQCEPHFHFNNAVIYLILFHIQCGNIKALQLTHSVVPLLKLYVPTAAQTQIWLW